VFLSVESFWMGAVRYIITEALTAAVLAPLVFYLLRRGEQFTMRFRAPAQ
jgi:hypothetical protein